MNKKFPLQNKHKFNFANSKSFGWLQIADIISYEMRKVNINKMKDFDEFISNNGGFISPLGILNIMMQNEIKNETQNNTIEFVINNILLSMIIDLFNQNLTERKKAILFELKNIIKWY